MSGLSKRIAEISWSRDFRYMDLSDEELASRRQKYQQLANTIAEEQEYRSLVALRESVSS